MLAGGRGAMLSAASVVREHELLVAVDAEDRPEHGPLVRLASAVEAEWLIDLFPERVTERRAVEWNRARSEEHTSELQSLMRISYAVFCLKNKKSTTVLP